MPYFLAVTHQTQLILTKGPARIPNFESLFNINPFHIAVFLPVTNKSISHHAYSLESWKRLNSLQQQADSCKQTISVAR